MVFCLEATTFDFCLDHIPAPSNGWCLNPKGFGTPWRVQVYIYIYLQIEHLETYKFQFPQTDFCLSQALKCPPQQWSRSSSQQHFRLRRCRYLVPAVIGCPHIMMHFLRERGMQVYMTTHRYGKPVKLKLFCHQTLGGGFKDFLFSPLFGEDSHFD